MGGIDAGIHEVQVQLLQDSGGSGKQGDAIFHVDDDLRIAIRGAAPGVADQHQWIRVIAVANDGGGLPGDVDSGILQEVLVVHGIPDVVYLFVGHILGMKDFPGFLLGCPDPGLPVYRIVGAAAQRPFGFYIKLAQ